MMTKNFGTAKFNFHGRPSSIKVLVNTVLLNLYRFIPQMPQTLRKIEDRLWKPDYRDD